MSRTTPEETFAEARTAMKGGDWEGFFACVDDDTLLRIAENGVARFLIGGRDDTADTTADTFTTLCQDQAVPQDMVLGLRTRLQRISESARASIASASDPAAMVQQSLRHKQVVDEYRQALRNMLKAVRDLSSFTAALERAMRAGGASGSVSSRLFEEVSITGTKA